MGPSLPEEDGKVDQADARREGGLRAGEVLLTCAREAIGVALNKAEKAPFIRVKACYINPFEVEEGCQG